MRRMVGLIVVTVLALAGCSSGNGSSTTAGTTTIAPGGATTSSTAPSFSGSKNSKYCNLARQFISSATINPARDTKAAFQQFDSLVGQFLATVPSEIKSDAQTLVGGLKQLEVAVKAANYDFTKLSQADLAPLEDQKFKDASKRIDEYDTMVCGISSTSS